ncbi:hypothetical protein [Streptoalloteichus tenebrarius]|nr:hypothetical protein [Streptoalloteichus tenebrarius]BFF03058.1 hypothetical protein GCM10020241_47330 [Streptoalloteichus tenebrarius]
MSELPDSGAARPAPVHSLDTVCPTCQGNHEITVAKLSVTDDAGVSLTGSLECPQCGGDGRLTGFVPPV